MKSVMIFLLTVFFSAAVLWSRNVTIQNDDTPQSLYAAGRLKQALQQNGYKIVPRQEKYDYLVRISLHHALLPEAFSIDHNGNEIVISGGDNRGLIYGTLALCELLNNGDRLADIRSMQEGAHLQFRGIKYNLPWETYRPSSALDQHFETARDLKYWEAFLDMMVENRFNVISLWNIHPYTFMIKPKNFPEASPWSEQQMADWQHFYHELLRMAKERALDTYLVHWNIFVSRQFAEAHKVAKENFYPHYYVPGDTSEIVRRYMRECIRQVLEEYPELDGIGVSHGEGMAGMTPLQRQQWVDDVIIAAMMEVDRPVKLIHRVPFSSGTSSEPGVSKNVELVTRQAMEKMGDHFDGPIWVEIKFNWSHAHSTPKLEKVHGGKLGDTYFVPQPANYRIVWQARNEDFFALRWGVPDFIRSHIALNGSANYVGGYFVGSETYIPALDYFTAGNEKVWWKWAFQRQWLFYKLWGRLLYNPQTPDNVFQSGFYRLYGQKATGLLQAYALASSTQLRLASLYDSRWDFTLYSEGFLALQGEYTKYISVDQLISQPTMASEYVSVGTYVDTILNGGEFDSSRIIPPLLAAMLEEDNRKALNLVLDSDAQGDASLMYELADIKIWANLGLHLAEKLRGAVALQKFRLRGDPADRQEAISFLKKALYYWDEVIRISRPLYLDMPLTHYNHNAFEANNDNLFHWALIRDEVARDIEIARNSKGK